MIEKKSNPTTYLNIIDGIASGRIGSFIFQKNNRIRVDNRYLKKSVLKKLAKEHRNKEL